MCLSTSLICFLFLFCAFVYLLLRLDLSSLPFSIAKLPFHLTFVPFYLLVHTELFLFAFLCNIDVLFSGNNIFSLSHDFVLFSHNCALSFLFVPFSNCYRLLTFILCVLMQYKCCFHETYCPTSMPFFFTIVSVYFTFFAFF